MRIRMLALAVTVICGYVSLLAAIVAPARPQEANHENPAVAQVKNLLAVQADAWNRGDIDSFMTTYWKSDQTVFVGASGVARGWQAVLERYHRTYPDRAAMGHVTFSNLEVHQECPDMAFVIGQYHLQRQKDQPSGVFTLNLRKFADGWRIVVDHTTPFPETHAGIAQ